MPITGVPVIGSIFFNIFLVVFVFSIIKIIILRRGLGNKYIIGSSKYTTNGYITSGL